MVRMELERVLRALHRARDVAPIACRSRLLVELLHELVDLRLGALEQILGARVARILLDRASRPAQAFDVVGLVEEVLRHLEALVDLALPALNLESPFDVATL